MKIKINCIYADSDGWCSNKKIKRSLYGLGARVCIENPYGVCEYKKQKLNKGIFPKININKD